MTALLTALGDLHNLVANGNPPCSRRSTGIRRNGERDAVVADLRHGRGNRDPRHVRLRRPQAAILCRAAARNWIARLKHVELTGTASRCDADRRSAHRVVAAGLRHLQVLPGGRRRKSHHHDATTRRVVVIGHAEADRAMSEA